MILTKSDLMAGYQCQKLLFFKKSKQLPEPTLADRHKSREGSIFETYARNLFPEGIDGSDDFTRTQFEAKITADELHARIDVLEPTKTGFNLYEIKSTNDVKPEHIYDLAFQKYVAEKKNLNIERCLIIHANKEYSKDGDINPKFLCKIEDVSEKVTKIKDLRSLIGLSRETMDSNTTPNIPIGRHCNSPRACPMKYKCWGYLPRDSVFLLTNHHTYWKLFNNDILDLKDIPDSIELKPKEKIILDATLNEKTHISKEEIKGFLDDLNYPLYHFDFETFQTGVPVFDRARPWQQIPFQYSLHIEKEDGAVEHKEFLSDTDNDPRPELLERMKTDLEGTGDIIVYNKTFEITRLKEMARDFPEHEDWIKNTIERIVDLEVPFKKYHYYNPEQEGKTSIKKVLPALTKESYKDLSITNGADASTQFFYSHIRKELEDKDRIRKDLLTYCKLDTEGMIWIIRELKRLLE